MKDRRVEFHEGALADVQSAVDWYLKHSSTAAVEFIGELQRAADTCSGDFPFLLFTQNKHPQSQCGPSLTAVVVRSIGRAGCRSSRNSAVFLESLQPTMHRGVYPQHSPTQAKKKA